MHEAKDFILIFLGRYKTCGPRSPGLADISNNRSIHLTSCKKPYSPSCCWYSNVKYPYSVSKLGLWEITVSSRLSVSKPHSISSLECLVPAFSQSKYERRNFPLHFLSTTFFVVGPSTLTLHSVQLPDLPQASAICVHTHIPADWRNCCSVTKSCLTLRPQNWHSHASLSFITGERQRQRRKCRG